MEPLLRIAEAVACLTAFCAVALVLGEGVLRTAEGVFGAARGQPSLARAGLHSSPSL